MTTDDTARQAIRRMVDAPLRFTEAEYVEVGLRFDFDVMGARRREEARPGDTFLSEGYARFTWASKHRQAVKDAARRPWEARP